MRIEPKTSGSSRWCLNHYDRHVFLLVCGKHQVHVRKKADFRVMVIEGCQCMMGSRLESLYKSSSNRVNAGSCCSLPTVIYIFFATPDKKTVGADEWQ